MLFVQPLTLSPTEYTALQRMSLRSELDFSQGLLKQAYQVYRVGTLLCCIARYGDAMMLMGVLQLGARGAHFRRLAQQLLRVAREWGCKTIETETSDERVAKLLQAVGAKLDRQSFILEVK